MFEPITSKITPAAIEANWQLPNDKGEKLFSADYVIEAYLSGKKHGEEQTKNLMVNQFKSNLNKSTAHTDTVLDLLKSKKITPISVHLRPNSFDDLEILITMSENDYLKDEFLNSLLDIATLEHQAKEEFYNISFNFINRSNLFDTDLLLSDGFLFSLKDFK
jgi:hypothetical protein